MSKELLWTCPKCGGQNSGNFCAKCGTRCPDAAAVGISPQEQYSEQFLKLQIRQQELIQEQEEKRIAAKEEKERKKREYNEKAKIYNLKSAAIPMEELKKWAGSWVVFVLAIVTTVTAICSLIALFTSFSGGWFKIISALVKLILNCLLCTGFWLSASMGRSKNANPGTSGPRMLRGVFTFYKVVILAALVLILALVIVLFATMKSCADTATEDLNEAGADVSAANTQFTGILVGILIAVVVIFIFICVCFSIITKFSNGAIESFTTKNVVAVNSLGVAILFFIIGGLSLIGSIALAGATSLLSDFLGKLSESNNTVGKYIPQISLNIPDLLAQIASSLTFIFGGILAIQYGRLPEKVRQRRSELVKPVLED